LHHFDCGSAAGCAAGQAQTSCARYNGEKDLGVIQLPALDKPVADGSLAYHYHSSGHTVLPADWKIFFSFADRHYKAATEQQPDNGPCM
jgi:hypothetical protein